MVIHGRMLKGDSSKPVSVYAQGNITNSASSSVGLRLNISNFTIEGSLAVDDIRISDSWTNSNQTNCCAISTNLSDFKVGIEYSTAIQWDDETQNNYTNCSISGWWIYVFYSWGTSGQGSLQPAY